MNKHIWLAVLFGICAAASTVFAQSFELRTGTWEFTMNGVQGAIPMDPSTPPAMRAQIEAEMRKAQTYKGCVTAEDLKDLRIGKMDDDDDEDCKVVSSKMTRTAGDIVRQCTGDQARTETSHFEAPTPQTMRANISSKTSAGTSTMTITGKWLAARCVE